MKQEKEYYAFISYKREDEKWAKWLQYTLEHYKFPTNLNGHPDLPKNIRPTFRDVTDLKPGVLSEEIHEALCNSQWLIVVCSPRSARSPWVCKEAQTFIDLGRADHIIPFVIEGSPFSDDKTTECFPEALRNLTGNRELLAANINEMGRDAAAIKVVARMFDLRFDALWQRYEKEKTRKRTLAMIAGLLFILLTLSIAAIIGKQNINIRKQRDTINTQNGLLEGYNEDLRQKIDSIEHQRNLITLQSDSIMRTNEALKQEREHVLSTLNEVLKRESKLIAVNAQRLCDDDDYKGARRLIGEFLMNYNLDLEKPITCEFESALRRSLEYESYKINGDSYLLKRDTVRNRLIGVNGTSVLVWDTSGQLLSEWRYDNSQDSRIYSFSMTRKGDRLMIPTWSGFVILDSHDGSIIDTISTNKFGNKCVFDENKGRVVLAAGEDGNIQTRLINNKDILTTSEYADGIWPNESSSRINISLNQNVYVARGNNEHEIIVADIETSDVIKRLPYGQWVSSANISPSGLYLAAASDSTVTIWNWVDNHILASKNFGYQDFQDISFSEDETMVAVVAGKGTCLVLDTKSLSVIKEIELNRRNFDGLSPSWDGALLLVDNKVIDIHGDYEKIESNIPKFRNTINLEKEIAGQKDIPLQIAKYMTTVTYESFGLFQYADTTYATGYCSDDRHRYEMATKYNSEYATLWKNGQLIKTLSIGDAEGASGPPFISRNGKIYGFDGNVYNTETHQLLSFCGWNLPVLLHNEKYFAVYKINYNHLESTSSYQISIFDVLSGIEVQKIELPFGFEIAKIEAGLNGDCVIVYGEDGMLIRYPFYSYSTLAKQVINELSPPVKSEYSDFTSYLCSQPSIFDE